MSFYSYYLKKVDYQRCTGCGHVFWNMPKVEVNPIGFCQYCHEEGIKSLEDLEDNRARAQQEANFYQYKVNRFMFDTEYDGDFWNYIP